MSDILQQFEWNYTAPPGYRARMLNCIFREWHRAHLLGMTVDHLKKGGKKISDEELQRLNFWIGAGGAWRGSALPYWDGFDLVSDVLTGNLGDNFRVGNAGAGRSYNYCAKPMPFALLPQPLKRDSDLAVHSRAS